MRNKRNGQQNPPAQDALIALREQINQCDDKGILYLKERLSLSKEVARIKAASGLAVFDANREIEIIEKFGNEFCDDLRPKIHSVMRTVLRISREVQYERIYAERKDWALRELLENAYTRLLAPDAVACQGIEGSYSHIAASVLFPDSKRVAVSSFSECIEKIKDKTFPCALLPLENTTAGTVNDVYDLIVRSNVYINQAVSIPINHCLVLLKGASLNHIKRVISHPQAIAQCSGYIREKGWERIYAENTAYAVRTVLEQQDPCLCAIASVQAGTGDGLQILSEPVCDTNRNRTRFVALSNRLSIDPHANKISIFFTLPHQSGSLASVLNVFAERGLNMTKIQSRPDPEKNWEYGFWVDLAAPSGDQDALIALLQLSEELPLLQLLGWYEDRTVD